MTYEQTELINLIPEPKTLTLAWEEINVYKKKSANIFKKCLPGNDLKQTNDQIINNVNGIAKPYEMLAILGASGSGKTTLLNTLNMRNIGSLKVEGSVKVNGQNIFSIEQISSISGYVQQNDLFIGTLKVKEHLIFQAMLKMEKNIKYEDKLKRVEEVLVYFNLKKCEKTIIGVPEWGIKGISGGERRRLSFASEIITNPFILFCDEPTTGLDSFMAYSIVDSMKKLAQTGKTIVFTIHQPSSDLFEMFDKVCLIAEGRLAYMGDRQGAHKFFESQGYKCPSKYNPAEYFIKTLSVSPYDRQNDLSKVHKLADAFEKSEYHIQINTEIECMARPELKLFADNDFKLYKSTFWTQIRWLLWRNVLATKRDSACTKILFLQAIFVGFMFGLLFYKIKNNQESIQNVNSVIFLTVIYSSSIYLFTEIKTFPLEISLFLREHQNGMYNVLSYYISKSLIEFPVHFICPIIFTSIIYYMSSLSDDWGKFVEFTLLVMLANQTSISFGHFLSAVSPTISVASGLAGPVIGPLMIFSGHLLNNSTTPKYFLWLKYLSWMSYANEGILISHWRNVNEIKCSDNSPRCLSNGQNVLDYMHVNKDDFFYTIYMQLFLITGWRIMAFIVLMIKSYSN